MNKRKLLTLALALCMVAILAVGGTLAYFTDNDSAKNTFTVGGVKIKLIEQQRSTDGKKLVDFVQNKQLFPIVGSAQGDKDHWGLSTAKNYVDKIVTVKNLKQDAWVRVYVAIPAALEQPAAKDNILHWNVGNKFDPNGQYTGNSDVDDYTKNMGEYVKLSGTTKIDGIDYNVYYFNYNKILTKNEVTGSAFFVGFYLDENVDADVTDDILISEDIGLVDGEWPNKTNWTMKGEKIDFDLSQIVIPVYAIGAQAAGFDTCDAAMSAAFGVNYNPWTN